MALHTIRLSDETAALYAKHSPDSPVKGIEHQLERFKNLPPGEPVMVLPTSVTKELERLGGKSFGTPEEILPAIRKLLTFHLEKLELSISAAQAQKLEKVAAFWKKSPVEWLQTSIRDFLVNQLGR